MLRYLNMFILMGVGLICVSAAGFASQGRFLKEPGEQVQAQPISPSLTYLIAGGLMILNGIVSARTAPAPSPRLKATKIGEDAEGASDTDERSDTYRAGAV